MSVPNRPGMIFPACPICGQPVTSTAYDQGVIAVPTDGGTLDQALNPATRVTMASRADAVPDDWQVVGPRELDAAGVPVTGAPEFDVLTLSCGCELMGPDVATFQLAAVNLTWRELRIELSVVVPPAATGDDTPHSFTKTTFVTVDELLADPDGVQAAVARHIAAAANLATAALTS
jgi:hypothetical protein